MSRTSRSLPTVRIFGRLDVAVDQFPLAAAVAQRHRALEADFDDLVERQQVVGRAEGSQRRAGHVPITTQGARGSGTASRMSTTFGWQPPGQRRLRGEEAREDMRIGRIAQHAGAHPLDRHPAIVELVVTEEDLAGRAPRRDGGSRGTCRCAAVGRRGPGRKDRSSAAARTGGRSFHRPCPTQVRIARPTRPVESGPHDSSQSNSSPPSATRWPRSRRVRRSSPPLKARSRPPTATLACTAAMHWPDRRRRTCASWPAR